MAEKKNGNRTASKQPGRETGKASGGKSTGNKNAPKNNGGKQTDTRTKAQIAAGEDAAADQRRHLVGILVLAVVLAFLALFLFLGMLGGDAPVISGLRHLVMGLIGYSFWVLPLALLFVAFMIVFRDKEPMKLRGVLLALELLMLSALLHTILCKAELASGFGIFKSLWTTGSAGQSGGVIPGWIASGLLIRLIGKGGTIPLLVVLNVILCCLVFRVPVGLILHHKAEKRREQLEQAAAELPEEPVVIDTMEDLRILSTPPIRPKKERPIRRDRKDFDIDMDEDLDDRRAEAPAQPVRDLPAEEPVNADDPDLALKIFNKNEKKAGKKLKKTVQRSPYDIPMEGDEEREDYTAEIQKLARQGIPEPVQGEPSLHAAEGPSFNDSGYEQEKLPFTVEDAEMAPVEEQFAPVSTEGATGKKTATLTEQEIKEGIRAANKSRSVSQDEAEEAAAEVAQEIEAKEDAEAQSEATYCFPPMSMLSEALGNREDNTEEMRANVLRLEETLGSFGVDTKIDNVVRGPTVTRYEMQLKPGVKMSKLTSLHEDIALALGVTGVRIAAVAGKNSVIGIEVPNRITTSVPIREVLSSREFSGHKSKLAFAVGKDIGGNYIVGDISKMPHLMIAGTTGSGKSVCMNSIIVSLLYRTEPKDCRMIMIDPKVVELSVYNGIPHLLIPVVTDAKKAAGALQWAVTEMERRYKLLADFKVRDMAGYNRMAAKNPDMEHLPNIVVIIDELADLMMVAAKEVENSIVRLAQKARAGGMYLVIATQRPSSDVITGLMKSNIPSRIAFAVSSAINSRIILDESGAEKLVGKGDMLYAPLGIGKPKRVQGCFITDEEVEEIVGFIKQSTEEDYSDDIIREIEQNVSAAEAPAADNDQVAIGGEVDPLLPEAVEVLLDTKQASVSMLQRRLKLGYAHAARIVDEMEENGIVGPFEGSKPRQLLITREQWDTMVGLNPRAKAAPVAPEELEDEPPFEEDE